MRALSNTKLLKKRQVTLIKKVLILLKILLSYGHLNQMYMKRVNANISTEENKMLISIEFYNTNIGLNCESY